MNSVKTIRIENYGKIIFKLDKVMKEKGLSKNKVAVGAGLNFVACKVITKVL